MFEFFKRNKEEKNKFFIQGGIIDMTYFDELTNRYNENLLLMQGPTLWVSDISLKNQFKGKSAIFLDISFDKNELYKLYEEFMSTHDRFFEEYFLKLIIYWAQIKIEKFLWQETEINPLFNSIGKSDDVFDISYKINSNNTSAFDKLKMIINSDIPEQLKYSEKKVIFCSDSFFNELLMDFKPNFIYNKSNLIFEDNWKMYLINDIHTDYNIKIIPTPGLNDIKDKYNGEPIIYTTEDNLSIETINDNFQIPNLSKFRTNMYGDYQIKVKGVLKPSIKNPNLIVRGYSF